MMLGKENSQKRKKSTGRGKQAGSSGKRLTADADLSQAVEHGKPAEVMSLLESSTGYVSPSAINNAVFQAAQAGQKRILQLLVRQCSNINIKDTKGYTALMRAAEHGYLDLIKVLVRNGADVNCQNKAGKTALMLAAEKACSVAIIEFLISQKNFADVNLQDKLGWTALMISSAQCDLSAMELLIFKQETDLNIKNRSDQTAMDIALNSGVGEEFRLLQECRSSRYFTTPLTLAVKKNSVEMVKSFLSDGYDDINLPSDTCNLSPLMLAVSGTTEDGVNMHIVRLLIEAGADVDIAHSETYWTPLIFAAQAGCLDAVKMLVEHGANVDAQSNPENMTALMIAAQKGCLDVVAFLIESKAKVETENQSSETALIIALKTGHTDCARLLMENGSGRNESVFRLAARHGQHRLFPCLTEDFIGLDVIQELFARGISEADCDLVSYLLDNGADVNQVMNSQDIPLIAAVNTNNNAMVRLLLKRGARVNDVSGEKKYTALIHAVCQNNGEIVQTLVKAGADMNHVSLDNTALMIAISLGDRARHALRSLLVCGVDTSFVSPGHDHRDSGIIPLHLAVSLRNGTTELLLYHGVDVNAQNSSGQTALMLAIPSSKTVQLLIRNRADVDIQDVCGNTALILAIELRARETVKILMTVGANVNLSNNVGETPLIKAAQRCTTDILDLLIKNGASVNAVDMKHSGALLQAVAYSIAKTDKVSLLIDNGANVNMANAEGHTPLIVAAMKCKTNVLSLLIEHGANVNAQDSYNQTALFHAASTVDETDKVEILIANGADVNIPNCRQCTPLISAAFKCNYSAMKALISAGANTNAIEEQTKHSAFSALSSFFSNYPLHSWDDARKRHGCLELLLNAEAKPDVSEGSAIFFHRLIMGHCHRLVQLYVSTGVAPPEIPLDYILKTGPHSQQFTDFIYSCSSDNVSPLLTAMYFRDTELCHFFIKNWFITQSDTALSRKPAIRNFMQVAGHSNTKLGAVLNAVLFQPWSLASLSFVVVSTAVGGGSDREHRIRVLPLPLIIQEKLLFKNICALQDTSAEINGPHSQLTGLSASGLLGLDAQD